jgi:hypothetical protein
MRDNRKKANDLKNLLDTVYNWENLSDEQRQILEEEGWLEELKIQYNELIKWIDTNLNKLDHEKENNEAREVWKNLWYEIIPISMDDENPNTWWSLNCRTDESRVFDNK